jgi:hypothetical protein
LELTRLATAEKRAALRNAARQGKPMNASAGSPSQVSTGAVQDSMSIAATEPSKDNNNLAVAPALRPQVTTPKVSTKKVKDTMKITSSEKDNRARDNMSNMTAPPPIRAQVTTEKVKSNMTNAPTEQKKKSYIYSKENDALLDMYKDGFYSPNNTKEKAGLDQMLKDRETQRASPPPPPAALGAFVQKGGRAELHAAEIVSPISKFTDMLSKTAMGLAQPAVTAAAAPSMMEGKAIEYLAAIAVGINKLTNVKGSEQPTPNNPAVPDTPGDPGIIFGGNYFPQKGRQWG